MPTFEPYNSDPPTPADAWTPGEGLVVEVPGPPGPTGPAPNLTIGTVTQGIEPAASITGTNPNYVLNLQLPQGNPGNPGNPGQPAQFTIGTVTTLPAGSSATATITGTAPNYVLNLGLPTGPEGPAVPGPAGSQIYHGNGAPPNSLGVQGDNYIDDAGRNWWGPKGASTWPTTPAFSLVAAASLPKRTFLTRSSNQAVGAWPVKLAFQAAQELNVTGTWSAATPNRIIVPVGSIYATVIVQIEVDGGATAGTLSAEVFRNGVQLSPRSYNNSGRNTTTGAAVNILTEATYEIPVNAGDYIEIEVNQTNLSANNIIATGTWCQVRFS